MNVMKQMMGLHRHYPTSCKHMEYLPAFAVEELAGNEQLLLDGTSSPLSDKLVGFPDEEILVNYPCYDLVFGDQQQHQHQLVSYPKQNLSYVNHHQDTFYSSDVHCPKRHKSTNCVQLEDATAHNKFICLDNPVQFVVPTTSSYPGVPGSCFGYDNPPFVFDEYQSLQIPGYGDHNGLGAEGLGASNGDYQFKEKKQSLSAQSIAARHRRRKIRDKTQQLAKLIPGANKLNTADMFHAAAKYVNFLQAQVAMLQLMAKEGVDMKSSMELHRLVMSPVVQEKLYNEQKCLVTKQFVDNVVVPRSDEFAGIDTLLHGDG